MSQENKAVARLVYAAITRGDLGALGELVADDMVEHEVFPGLEPNKQGVLQFFENLRKAFPDLSMTADDMISEGDKVFVRGTMAGTHKGEFMGMEGTGRQISVAFADFLRLENGKFAEHWGVTDTGAMMEQLGAAQS